MDVVFLGNDFSACLVFHRSSPLNSKQKNSYLNFSLLERTSTRSRLMNFFRGRSRAAERNETAAKEHDHSQITFIDQTSMK